MSFRTLFLRRGNDRREIKITIPPEVLKEEGDYYTYSWTIKKEGKGERMEERPPFKDINQRQKRSD